MSLKDKNTEIQRLIDAFEAEAAKFHEIQFHTFFITPPIPEKFYSKRSNN